MVSEFNSYFEFSDKNICCGDTLSVVILSINKVLMTT